MVKVIKNAEGAVFIRFPNGHEIPQAAYAEVKAEFAAILGAELLPGLKKKLLDSGEVVDPASLTPFEAQERPSLTQTPDGVTYLDHMKAEVDRANAKYPAGKGGGVVLSSEHIELQNTANGAVFVFPDKVVDMASALKTALRTNEPLADKTISMSLALIAVIKDGPGETDDK